MDKMQQLNLKVEVCTQEEQEIQVKKNLKKKKILLLKDPCKISFIT
jgi:hypothetical protein